jgi:uncharacterized glyoxalase superfamily protein PhnB
MSDRPDASLNHVHAKVRDLGAAVSWFEAKLGLKPDYRDDRLASFSWGAFSLLLDAADADSIVTLGFQSRDCDGDFRAVVAKGAVALEPPADRPWGARAAYVRGPGAITVEFEQMRKSSRP